MLKYLFTAHFADGSTIQQTQDDVSIVEPSKSAFYDVLNHPSDIVSFSLSSGQHTCGVDLRSGAFEIDSVAFRAQDPSRYIPLDAKRRLIYFRDVKQHLHITGDQRAMSTETAYHLGWQATLETGENVQQTVCVE